jgi:haloalkane dehalogenase
VAARPDWIDPALFPYESRFLELDGAHVHYIDEGSGPTLLMLHGNPTWSFLYRDIVAALRDRFRCLALDYPGFGLSTPPPDYGFTVAEHAEIVTGFVAELGLEDWTPVVQDWGGPVGLAAAARAPEKVAALAILNTWAWPLQGNRTTSRFSKLMGGPIGQFAIIRLNGFVNLVIPLAVQRGRPARAVMDHYRSPLPTPQSRRAAAILPRELLAARPFLERVEKGLERLRHLPALLCFSDGDPLFGKPDQDRFAQALPNHRRVTVVNAGHYLQEDAPLEIAEAVARWHPALAGAPASPA